MAEAIKVKPEATVSFDYVFVHMLISIADIEILASVFFCVVLMLCDP